VGALWLTKELDRNGGGSVGANGFSIKEGSMTVQDLIDALNKVEDKTLSVRVLEYRPEDENFDEGNYFLENDLDSVIERSTGSSGYELHGEVLLTGYE
jgi:hypothetical protein